MPPLEIVGWRIVFTLPLCLAIIAARGLGGELRLAFTHRPVALRLCFSAFLVAGNWLLYVFAINNGHVLAASLGYYINPLLNVLLGTLFLGEKLNRVQWGAVAVAALGVGLLVVEALDMVSVALTLAISFALYGLVRKLTPVGAVPGLTVETSVLFLPALGVVAWYAASPAGSSLAQRPGSALLLAGTGVLTGVPLLLFAAAAQKLTLSTLGFIQFLAPTMVFVQGLVLFNEPLDAVRLACFVLIWLAIALFSWDMLRRARSASPGR